jgi:hypothetical protein
LAGAMIFLSHRAPTDGLLKSAVALAAPMVAIFGSSELS